MNDIIFRNHKEAFEDAIFLGRLSRDEKAENYAGNYMYMGTRNGRDLFKHVITRDYYLP